MADDLLGANFRRPFPEQVTAYLARLANPQLTERWDEVLREAHDRTWMVAGANKADLLADLADAMTKVIVGGVTEQEFGRDFLRIAEQRGWHGWTGEDTAAGQAWRIRTIYRTNLRTSYMAGRFAQLREDGFPLWIYRHGGSLEPRLQHLAWDGLVLPAEHPFWATHFPPNGWGCSCEVYGARDMDHALRKGGDPTKTLSEGWDRRLPATGAPPGIGKAWDYPPGASMADTIRALAPKVEKLPLPLARDLVHDWVKSDAFRRWSEAPSANFPLAVLSPERMAQIGAEVRTVLLSPQTWFKQRSEHPELSIFEYALVQEVIDQSEEVIEDGPIDLIFILKNPGSNGRVLVVKATRSGQGLFLTSLRRLSRNEAEAERELRRLRSKNG